MLVESNTCRVGCSVSEGLMLAAQLNRNVCGRREEEEEVDKSHRWRQSQLSNSLVRRIAPRSGEPIIIRHLSALFCDFAQGMASLLHSGIKAQNNAAKTRTEGVDSLRITHAMCHDERSNHFEVTAETAHVFPQGKGSKLHQCCHIIFEKLSRPTVVH